MAYRVAKRTTSVVNRADPTEVVSYEVVNSGSGTRFKVVACWDRISYEFGDGHVVESGSPLDVALDACEDEVDRQRLAFHLRCEILEAFGLQPPGNALQQTSPVTFRIGTDYLAVRYTPNCPRKAELLERIARRLEAEGFEYLAAQVEGEALAANRI